MKIPKGSLRGLVGFAFAFAFFFGLDSSFAQGRNRVDLDDMMIKGELHNDDRLMILSRQKNELKNYVKFRTNFREEMLQELPVPKPKTKF